MLRDVLTSLPESLSCIILRDWLSLKSVVTLNSAFCCISSREMFLTLLESDEYFVCDRVTIARCKSIVNVLHIIGSKLTSVQFGDDLSNSQSRLLAAYCNNLTHVYYRGSSAKMKLQNVLRANPFIEHLELSNELYSPRNGRFINVPGFHKISLRNLQSLTVYGFRDIDGELQKATLGMNVVRLDLSNSRILDTTLVKIGNLCPTLRCCGLASTKICDDVLVEFTKNCPHIAHLDISYNPHITDAGILGVVQNLRVLQSLNVSSMNTITNASLQHIYTYCAGTLHTLHVYTTRHSVCALQGGSVVNNLLERCTNMRVLRTDLPCIFSQQAICNLTTLVLEGNFVCLHNLTNIGKYCSLCYICRDGTSLPMRV